MATYVVVAKDQESLGPNEINAGDTIYVEDGDQVIIDPSADDDIKFEAADGGPAQFEILFRESNPNDFDVEIKDGLSPVILVLDDVDLSEVKFKADDAEAVTFVAGDRVTIDKYEGSKTGVDTVTAGDDFTVLDEIKTEGGNDSIRVGDNATIKEIDAGQGDDRVQLGSGASVGKLDGGKGNDQLVTQSQSQNSQSQNFETTGVVCFTKGTLIETPQGKRAIEDLVIGDLVLTADHGAQPLRWIGERRLGPEALRRAPKLCPVRIAQGALGAGLPSGDLLVSRQHRVLVRSRIAERMFGQSEVLVPAHRLVGLPGISAESEAEEVTYFHLLFDQHEILFSNDAETESLYPGPQALASLGPAAVGELYQLFPELALPGVTIRMARFVPETGRAMKRLAARHQKNHKPLVERAA
jgi:hypothetical protein